MLEQEEAPASVEEPDGSQGTEPTVDTTVDTEAAVIDDVDATTKSGESQEQTLDQFDYTPYKNTERFAGRGLQEVFDHLSSLEYKYGQQSNELGESRRYKAELENLRRQVTGQKPATETKPKLSEVEMAMFAQKFQEDPAGAINEFIVPKLTENMTTQVLQRVGQNLGPALRGHAQDVADKQEADALFRNHPELNENDELLGMTRSLMSPNYLGNNVRYEEAYSLAKMTKSNPSLFPTTCYLMRTGLSFKEAKEYASLKKNAPVTAQTTKDQIKEEITSISGGTKRTTTKSGTNKPVDNDMDEVFDADN